MPDIFAFMAFTAVSSALACFALIKLARVFPRMFGYHGVSFSVQIAHDNPTARVGGLAVISALVLSTFLASIRVSTNVQLVLLSGALLFFVSLLEDLGYTVSPKRRLAAAFVSASIFVFASQHWVHGVGLPLVDSVFAIAPIGIFASLIFVSGLANAMNMIDGSNGLAAFASIASAMSLASIAGQTGNHDVQIFLYLFSASFLGFFVINFPKGYIFLGDAGAYMSGFILSCATLLILDHGVQISPWALILAIFWPTFEIFSTMIRRRREKLDPTVPDKFHTHQVIRRLLEIRYFGSKRRNVTNPLSTLILMPFIVLPAIVATFLWNTNIWSFLFFAFYTAIILFLQAFVMASLATRAARLRRTR